MVSIQIELSTNAETGYLRVKVEQTANGATGPELQIAKHVQGALEALFKGMMEFVKQNDS